MNRIALIDFSHALRVQYHVRTPDGTPTSAGENTLQQLSDWRRSFDHVIVCLDSPPYARKEILPTYKSSRERDDGYQLVCRWTKDRLVKDGYSIAVSRGAEADDVIATLAMRLWERGKSAYLIGGDKDMAQCVREEDARCVRIIAPLGGGKWEERNTEWVKTKYCVAPSQMALFQALTGDNSDDIPGVDGVGPKGAAKLITEFGTIEKMRIAAVAALEASMLPGAKPLSSFWRKFLAGSPELPKWLSLTTLRVDVPLDVDALLTKQPIQSLVAAEAIEHGDAWEPSEEEMKEEREMLAPEDVISGPKGVAAHSQAALTFGTAAGAGAATQTRAVPSDAAPPEAKTEPGKATTPAQPTATATSAAVFATSVPSDDTAGASPRSKPEPSPRQPRVVDEITSIVVDRPEPPNWALALQPSTAKEALQIAAVLFNSRVCSQFGSEKGVYAVISLGRELGLGMMQSLQGFHIVKDRPFPGAPLLQALAEADPNCEWLVCTESTEERATWKTKHRVVGEMSFTYDRAEATKNGCYTGANKHNWQARERQMMRKTCMANAVRIWYPRAVAGLHLSEEMNDE